MLASIWMRIMQSPTAPPTLMISRLNVPSVCAVGRIHSNSKALGATTILSQPHGNSQVRAADAR